MPSANSSSSLSLSHEAVTLGLVDSSLLREGFLALGLAGVRTLTPGIRLFFAGVLKSRWS